MATTLTRDLHFPNRVQPDHRRNRVAHAARRCALPTVHFGGRFCLFRSEPKLGSRNHKIAVIGGDGIGPEVTAEALKVARAAGADLAATDYDLGGARFLRTAEVLPDSVLDELRKYDAILLGAVGTPDVPPGVLERGLLLRLRFELDLYINLRPFTSERLNCIVIRENTEGTYAGEGGFLRKGTLHEVATQGSVNTRMGVERCIRYAFDLAAARERHE